MGARESFPRIMPLLWFDSNADEAVNFYTSIFQNPHIYWLFDGVLMVGSDTGIRTRVSAVRGRRPGPLDDIANADERRKGRFSIFPRQAGSRKRTGCSGFAIQRDR